MSNAIHRTQVRFPSDIYFRVRYVAAAMDISFNTAVMNLLLEALEGHHEHFPSHLLQNQED